MNMKTTLIRDRHLEIFIMIKGTSKLIMIILMNKIIYPIPQMKF